MHGPLNVNYVDFSISLHYINFCPTIYQHHSSYQLQALYFSTAAAYTKSVSISVTFLIWSLDRRSTNIWKYVDLL